MHALGRRVLQDDPAVLAAAAADGDAQQIAPTDPAPVGALGTAPAHDYNSGWSAEYTKVVDGVTKTCHKAWYGTAPTCRGECPYGFTFLDRQNGPNDDVSNCARARARARPKPRVLPALLGLGPPERVRSPALPLRKVPAPRSHSPTCCRMSRYAGGTGIVQDCGIVSGAPFGKICATRGSSKALCEECW